MITWVEQSNNDIAFLSSPNPGLGETQEIPRPIGAARWSELGPGDGPFWVVILRAWQPKFSSKA